CNRDQPAQAATRSRQKQLCALPPTTVVPSNGQCKSRRLGAPTTISLSVWKSSREHKTGLCSRSAPDLAIRRFRPEDSSPASRRYSIGLLDAPSPPWRRHPTEHVGLCEGILHPRKGYAFPVPVTSRGFFRD